MQPPVEPAQYRAIRYTERLAEADAVASIGSKGDSYDNAMAEAFNSLFKGECIRNPTMRPKAAGHQSATSKSPSPNTSTGSTTEASMARSGTSHPSSSRPHTGHPTSPSATLENRFPSEPVPDNQASTKPGALQAHRTQGPVLHSAGAHPTAAPEHRRAVVPPLVHRPCPKLRPRLGGGHRADPGSAGDRGTGISRLPEHPGRLEAACEELLNRSG